MLTLAPVLLLAPSKSDGILQFEEHYYCNYSTYFLPYCSFNCQKNLFPILSTARKEEAQQTLNITLSIRTDHRRVHTSTWQCIQNDCIVCSVLYYFVLANCTYKPNIIVMLVLIEFHSCLLKGCALKGSSVAHLLWWCLGHTFFARFCSTAFVAREQGLACQNKRCTQSCNLMQQQLCHSFIVDST
jgi:hypothetical protein